MLPPIDWDTATPEEEEAYWNLPLFMGRDYELFAILAGVRNHLRVQPISPPRGIPRDAGEAVRAAWATAQKYPEVHTPSWLSLQELLDFDWNQSLIHRVSGDEEALRPHSEQFLTYRDAVSDNNFVNRGLAQLQTLVENPADLRMVFWFDS
ncbi:hypothetical protein DEMA109039_11990 [Deinococcus marmoris]